MVVLTETKVPQINFLNVETTMFKKKPTLPARPMPPSFELIEEDINQAPSDDVAFTLIPSRILQAENAKKSSSMEFKDNYDNGSESENEDDYESDPNVLYNKVKTFVDVNNSLKTYITSLHENYATLLGKGQSLQIQTADVKKQIATALQEQNIDHHQLLSSKPT